MYVLHVMSSVEVLPIMHVFVGWVGGGVWVGWNGVCVCVWVWVGGVTLSVMIRWVTHLWSG